MKIIKLTVNKSYVFDEVSMTSGYVGAKLLEGGDDSAYNRIFVTDADKLLIERFWAEACVMVTNILKPYLVSVVNLPIEHGVALDNNYVVELKVSDKFNDSLQSSLEASLFSLFIKVILSKWYDISNKSDSISIQYEIGELVSTIKSILRAAPWRRTLRPF